MVANKTKTCPHCGKTIDDYERTCHHCLKPLPGKPSDLGILILVFGGVILLAMLWGWSRQPTRLVRPDPVSVAEQPAYLHPTQIAAKEFLRQQQSSNQATIRATQQARDAGKPSQAIPILEQRHRELLSAITEVDVGIRSGRFHKDDRTLLLDPLEEEMAWVNASLIFLRSP